MDLDALVKEFERTAAFLEETWEKIDEMRKLDVLVREGPRGGQKIDAQLKILDQLQQSLCRLTREMRASSLEPPIPENELQKLLD